MEDRQQPLEGIRRSLVLAALALLLIPAAALGQTFHPVASPNPVTLQLGGGRARVTVETNPDPGLLEPITYTFVGLPAFVATGGSQVSLPPTYPPRTFTFSLRDGAAPGRYHGALRGVAGPTVVEVRFDVVVLPPPSVSASLRPNPLKLTVGGPGALVTVETQASHGFAAPISYRFVGLPPFVGTGGSRTAAPPGYPPQSFPFSLTPGATPGTYEGLLRGSAAGGVTVEIPFRLEVVAGPGPPPGYAPAVAPNPVELVVGEAPLPVAVTTTAEAGFERPVTYSFTGLPAFVRWGGVQRTGPPAYSPRTFLFSLDPGAMPGTYSGFLRARSPGLPEQLLPITVIVRPPRPVVERVVPATLAAGSRSQPLRLVGRNFEPGAAVTSDDPAVAVETARVISPQLAEVTVSVAATTSASIVQLELINPSGESSSGGARVTVLPADSLAAPLSVSAPVIVHPRPGAQIGLGDAVHPRGLLTVTGSGPILGSWLVDGVVFERFSVHAVAGQPVSVVSRMPLPQLARGEHDLSLEVTQPQRLASPPVTVIQTLERVSGLRQLAPIGRAIVGAEPLVFEWTLVPGAIAYEVELEPPAPAPPGRWQTAANRWRPPASARDELGTGLLRWRVRAVFPGDVPGEPTAWRELALLPASVDLTLATPRWDGESGRWRLEWSGGTPGLVYRIVVADRRRDGEPFEALTMRQEYSLPPERLRPREGYRVRVEALTPAGDVLGESATVDFETAGAEGAGGGAYGGAIRLLSSSEAGAITGLSPAPEAVVESGRPLVEGSWEEPVEAARVLLFVDGTEVSGISEVEPTSVRHRPLEPLAPGEHLVVLHVAGTTRSWSFEVAPPTGEGAEPRRPRAAPRPSVDGRFDAELSASASDGDEPLEPGDGRLSLSGQVAAESPAGALSGTTDLSWSHPFDGSGATRQESRSWLLRGERTGGPLGGELGVGYGAPTFLEGTEILAAGLARGGVEGSVGSPGRLRLAYYESFDGGLDDVAGGSYAVDQSLRAAAIEIGGGEGRFELRALGLEVDQRATPFDAGGEGRSVGVLARFAAAPGFDLVFEAARGRLEPGEGSRETKREGDAYRLGIAGNRGALAYALDLRRIEPGFVNPAAAGLSASGRSDRDSIELTLSRAFGAANLGGRLQHIDGGDGFGPPAVVDSLEVDYSNGLGETLFLTLGGSFTATRADGDPDLFLPESDRRDWGLEASLSTTLGALQLVPAASVERSTDRRDPTAEVTTTGVGLAAFLGGRGIFSLSGSVNGSRVDADASIGRTDTTSVSLQPVWEIASVRLQPYAAYTEVSNQPYGGDTTSEQYVLTVAWEPSSTGSAISFELSGDWSRTRGAALPDEGFAARYLATLVVRRGGSIEPSPGTPRTAPPSPPPAPAGAATAAAR